MSEQIVEEVPAPPVAPLEVSWAGIPRVNLLPITIIEGRRFRRTQAVLGASLLGVVVIAGAGTFWAQHQVGGAQDGLDTAQVQVRSLTAEQAKYQAVPQIISQVEAASAARATVMADDVAWYTLLNDVAGAIPADVTESSMSYTVAGASSGTATSAATNPLSATGVGTFAVSGTAAEYDAVAGWMEALDKVNGIDSPALTGASTSNTSGARGVSYGLTAVLTDQVLTHRYDQKEK